MAAVESAPDFVDTVSEPPAPVPATRRTRIVYCLALAGLVLGMLGQATSWVGLAFGGGVIGYLGPTAFLVITALVIYRIYRVTRYPSLLDARPPNFAGRALRGFGWVVMAAGAVAASATIVRWPAFLLGGGGPAGIGFFVVGIFATIVASLGWIGCLLFDASRYLGAHVPAAHQRTRRQRLQDWSVLGGLVVLAIGTPWALKQFEPNCWGLSECAARIDGDVKRPVAVDWGEPLALEANIDAIVYRQSHGEDWTLMEQPSYSLLRAGHPTSALPAPVQVSVQAAVRDQGASVVLTVTERGAESARFSMYFRNARLATVDGERRLVVDLGRRVAPGMFRTGDSERRVLDALYRQMRQAIGTPREVEVALARREVRAELIGTSRGDPGWKKPETALAGCEGVLKIVRAVERDPQFDGSMWEASFVGRTAPPMALLMQRDDIGTCSDRAIWLADNYPGRPLQLRKYDLNGMLLKSLHVSFPPSDEAYRGFLDLRKLAERDDGIELVFVKSHSAGLTLERYRLGP